ncbi:MAG: TonB-dependent receptor [Bdellovibrionales bacterium]|nr:TonB-dependent receptor [Bdellovibrionales bacterium]
MNHALIIITIFLFSTSTLASEVDYQEIPEDIVTAPRIDSFSERSGGWPSQIIPTTSKQKTSQNWWTGWEDTQGVSGRYEGAPAISIRGSVKSDRSLLLWDGIPLNLADGLGPSELLIPTEIIGHTHVFKGPASVYYGRSALGGALLNQSELSVSPHAKLKTGSFSSNSAEGRIPLVHSSGHYQASFMASKTEGDYPYEVRSNSLSGRREHNASELQRYTLIGKSQRGSWSLEPRLLYARKKGEYPGRIDDPTTAFTPGNGVFDRQASLIGLRATNELGRDESFSWLIAGIRSDQDSDPNTVLYSHSRTDRLYQGLNYFTKTNSDWKVKLFADHFVDDFTANYLSDQNLHSGELEAGASLEIPTSPSTFIQPAVRYLDEYNKGVAALGFFHKDEQFEKWMTFGQGFRPPTLADRFCNNAFCLGNPDLQPERSEQIEIGFITSKQNSTLPANREGRLDYGLSIFQMDHRDYFEFTTVGLQYQTINSGEASIFGGELFFQYDSGGLLSKISLTHLDGENRTLNRQLLLVPEWQGSLRLSKSHDRWGVWSQLKYTGSYLDQRDSAGPILELGKVWTVDAGLTFSHKTWTLELSGLNLFDQALERRAGYPDPQRELRLQIIFPRSTIAKTASPR